MDYDTGKCPSVALGSLDNATYAIGTHHSKILKNYHTKIGIVNEEERSIEVE